MGFGEKRKEEEGRKKRRELERRGGDREAQDEETRIGTRIASDNVLGTPPRLFLLGLSKDIQSVSTLEHAFLCSMTLYVRLNSTDSSRWIPTSSVPSMTNFTISGNMVP